MKKTLLILCIVLFSFLFVSSSNVFAQGVSSGSRCQVYQQGQSFFYQNTSNQDLVKLSFQGSIPGDVVSCQNGTTGYDSSINQGFCTFPRNAFPANSTRVVVQNQVFGTITCTFADGTQDGALSINSATITNAPPVIAPMLPVTSLEGAVASSSGSFTDPDSTSWTATIDYADGSGIQPLFLNPDQSFSLSHVYADEGTYTQIITITDNQGLSSVATTSIVVLNAPFTMSAITAPTLAQAVNATVSASAVFNDPGLLDTHTNLWDWGDGSTSVGTIVTPATGSGVVSNTHQYTKTGIYTISLTVTDDDSLSVTKQFQSIIVIDPTSAFLNASGSFVSKPGWDVLSPLRTENVKLHVHSRYKNMSMVPTGEANIDFQIGSREVEVTSFSWLIVNGSQATLFGTATINDAGSYAVLISLLNGQQNFIRVQITDTSTQAVIYDTQPNAPVTAAPTAPLLHGTLQLHSSQHEDE